MQIVSSILEALNLIPRRRPCAGALCWRRDKKGIEILLVTTRRTGRWTPPKGNLGPGGDTAETAAQEALEEAGAVGVVSPEPLGVYRGQGSPRDDGSPRFSVTLHALKVDRLEDCYKEKSQRQRKWFRQEDAANKVREGDLRRLIRDFSP